MDKPYLPLDALAGHLGLPRAWLRREADEGRLPYLQLKGRRVFDPAVVRRVLHRRSKLPVEATP